MLEPFFCQRHPASKIPTDIHNHLPLVLFIYVLLMFADGTNAKSLTLQAVIYCMQIRAESDFHCSANVFINQSLYYLDLTIGANVGIVSFLACIHHIWLFRLVLLKQINMCSTQLTNYFNCKILGWVNLERFLLLECAPNASLSVNPLHMVNTKGGDLERQVFFDNHIS